MKKVKFLIIVTSVLQFFLFSNLYANDPLDTDNNGILDGWEIQYFGELLGENKFNDSDNDGYSDYIEFKSNTIPTDSSSIPATHTEIIYEYDSIGRIKKTTRNIQ